MKNWNACFVPECYFDTVLFKRILQTDKRLKHTKGCYNVVNRFRIINGKKGDLYDSFGVGMVDKDKKELDFLNECSVLGITNNLLLWKHKERPHFVIQLTPPLERWVIEIMRSVNLSLEEFGYPSAPKALKKALKDDIDSENNEKLNKLINIILSSGNQTVEVLKATLLHLRDENINADMEQLKRILAN